MPGYLLLKGGTIVNAHETLEGDVLVSQGKIVALGENLNSTSKDTRILDVSGCYLFPGGIDPHVHMELSVGNGLVSTDNFESGSMAALFGGTTTIIDFVTPEPGQSLINALYHRKRQATSCYCDYSLHMSITSFNPSIRQEMMECVKNEGIPSFKVYMAYKKHIGLDDNHILEVMDAAAQLNALVMVHCENGEIIPYLQQKLLEKEDISPLAHAKSRPAYIERDAVVRAISLARAAQCGLYIVHISTSDAVKEIIYAQKRDQVVIGETCPHYLLLDEENYKEPGFSGAKYVVSPPLRNKNHQVALWDAINREHIAVTATDHCPFNLYGQKDMGEIDFTKIPSGAAGVEHRLALLYTYGVKQRKISLQQLVAQTSSSPAKIFGLYPQKGKIAVHSDADIVVWDPGVESNISASTHHHNCDSSIFEGTSIIGEARYVILRGLIAIESHTIKIPGGSGRFLKRNNQPF